MPDRTFRQELVVAIDGSSGSDAALQWAAHDASLRDAGLVVVHVLPDADAARWLDLPSSEYFDLAHRAREILDEAKRSVLQAVGPKVIDVRTRTATGNTVARLVELAKDADMIVVGSRGHGRLERLVLGSVSSGLVRHARCSVAVIHGNDVSSPKEMTDAPVVVGFDGSPASEVAMAIAFDEAALRDVELIAVHAYSDASAMFPPSEWLSLRPFAVALLNEGLARWGKSYPQVRVRHVVARDRPEHQLLELSAQAQLLVVGSSGRGRALGTRLGSVSSAVAQYARVPVIVARRSWLPAD